MDLPSFDRQAKDQLKADLEGPSGGVKNNWSHFKVLPDVIEVGQVLVDLGDGKPGPARSVCLNVSHPPVQRAP